MRPWLVLLGRMNCPKCSEEMEEGILRLSAGGFADFAFFRANLRFNERIILQDNYKPFVGLLGGGGQKVNAFGCDSCAMICFEY